MGGLWSKIKGFIAGMMVYDTVALVRIKDKRLALLHYVCMIVIFLYIVCYTIIYNKAYYDVEAPVGTVRINPMAPKPWTDTAKLPYCEYPNRTGKYHLTRIAECLYFDEALNVFPQALDESITITTRVNISTQKPQGTLNSSSVWWMDVDNELAYLADPENFTLMIDHSFYAPTLNIQGNARDLHGFIVSHDGKNITKPLRNPKETIGIEGKPDIISVGTLLRAAGVDLDSMTIDKKTNESLRSSGAIIFVFLDYQNSVSINPFNKDVRYTIRAELMSDTEFKAVQSVYTKSLNNSRVIYNRHGVHFVFVQTGQLVRFSFQVLLISFVSGIGLITVATTVVDFIATYLLNTKDVVSTLKYKTTTNFAALTEDDITRLASKIRRIQEQELNLSEHSSESVVTNAADGDVSVTFRQPLLSPSDKE